MRHSKRYYERQHKLREDIDNIGEVLELGGCNVVFYHVPKVRTRSAPRSGWYAFAITKYKFTSDDRLRALQLIGRSRNPHRLRKRLWRKSTRLWLQLPDHSEFSGALNRQVPNLTPVASTQQLRSA